MHKNMEKWIFFQNRDELLRVNLHKVVYFEADANYTNIYTVNNMKIVVGMNLGNTQQMLSRQSSDNMPVFMRIGKKYIINTHFICQIHIAKQKLVLSDFERFAFTLPASKEALKTVKEMCLQSIDAQ